MSINIKILQYSLLILKLKREFIRQRAPYSANCCNTITNKSILDFFHTEISDNKSLNDHFSSSLAKATTISSALIVKFSHICMKYLKFFARI